VQGRKQWLFSNTPNGAESSSIIYSIIETAKENGLDPFRYLTYIFKTAAGVNLRENKDMVVSLLPENAPESCKVLK